MAPPIPEDLPGRLRAHVVRLASEIGERNSFRYPALEQARLYIEERFTEAGYAVRHDAYQISKRVYRNVIAERAGSENNIFIIGAHYDTAPGTPGADDNASAVAVLLELARFQRGFDQGPAIRWVAFTLEEPPFYGTSSMGSRVHARSCRRNKEPITGMAALEMVGYYKDSPGSQSYPLPFMSGFYPKRGDFIAIAGNFSSRRLVEDLSRRMSQANSIPVVSAAFPFVPGAGLSDNWSFWKEGYPALMITDTAFFRNPHYHMPTDLPQTLDYQRMAALVIALHTAIRLQPS